MKKPALPEPTQPGFPAAVRMWLQIICGRRTNRIEPPPYPSLTFSSSPTKAECEALLAYTNRVNAAVHALIDRLDQ